MNIKEFQRSVIPRHMKITRSGDIEANTLRVGDTITTESSPDTSLMIINILNDYDDYDLGVIEVDEVFH